MGPAPGAVILLHGASSAGKTTVARALQDALDRPFLRLSLDLMFFGDLVLPRRRGREGPFAWSSIKPRLVAGFCDALGAMARAGNDLVVDHIIESDADRDRLVAALRGLDVFTVALHCPVDELERRERARGDRRIGDARRDLALVARYGPYDLDVDSTEPPERNAARIAAAWQARVPPGRFGA
jgi:chloramphenicol 3-O phosphotransferase